MADHAAPPAEDRHTAMLRELAAMSLTLARELQQRALQAETPDEAVRLATAFHRVSRGLRQTLALELKVVRHRDDQAREAQVATDAAAEAAAAALRPQAIADRREQVRKLTSRAIWTEHDPPDWRAEADDLDLPAPPQDTTRLACDLQRWLDRAVRRADFLSAPVDDLVREACAAIGADPAFIYAPARAPAPEPDHEPDREPAVVDTG
ncbi:hypothetical protein [Phenylobacterium sp.]|uniref:hypothetical protein n=1 Tax=Phenylobacterium sp. TaxID=1871053 RepID=UPI002B5D08CE|nr:hypothetical protein [Phenylobacterium sp.]HVI34079.1 hypothetical protein [Phenylobacterium sp.]